VNPGARKPPSSVASEWYVGWGGILLMVDERPDMIKVLLDISVLVGQSLVMNGHLNWKASERKDRPHTSDHGINGSQRGYIWW
jgi:hypothetical protein